MTQAITFDAHAFAQASNHLATAFSLWCDAWDITEPTADTWQRFLTEFVGKTVPGLPDTTP